MTAPPVKPLRILSIITLWSPLGEYGGPVRVAANQALELMKRGHDVTLAGGTRGYGGSPPTQIEGVPALLFPASQVVPRAGFAGLAAPGLWSWLRRHVADFDVVHVHVARDFVTLPAAWIAHRAGVPYVLQPHGMIDASSNPLAGPLDAVLTKRVLRGARRVLYLTETERQRLTAVAGDGLPLEHLLNGVPVPEEPAVAVTPRVLYLARLAPRKRPGMFVEMAHRLAPDHPDVDFVLVGPDEGEGRAVRARVAELSAGGVRVRWAGAVAPEKTLEEMHQASVFVLPSVDEPNGMSVLEAMSIGLPVVITDTCGLSYDVRTADAGAVVGPSLESLVEGVEKLLSDPEEARAKGLRGRQYVDEHLSMARIAEQLEDVYAE